MVDFHECPVFLFTLKQCKFCSLSLGDIDDDPRNPAGSVPFKMDPRR